jgi:hypothetical protein
MRQGLEIRANVTVCVVDAATRRVLRVERQHNLVVTTGLNLIRDLLNGDAVAGLTYFAVGTGTTPVASTDTTLAAEVFRDAVTQTIKGTAELTVKYFLPTTQANGNTLAEAGLFNAASVGTMFARVVLAATIVKTSAIEVTFAWDLTFAPA